MVLCDDCEGVEAHIPVADAVTDKSGHFALAVPDPGVSAAARAVTAHGLLPIRAKVGVR
jgi:hypothetical protein